MKIKLKFTVDQIMIINELLNKFYTINFNSLSNQEKIEFSICYILSDLFENKKRNIQKKNEVFNSRKEISITLKYHEAWALKNILVNNISLLENNYQLFSIQNSINLLDSKK